MQGLHRWLSGKESECQCRRLGFDPWVGKIPWRSKWQLTQVFLSGESHGQRSLLGYSPWGRRELDMTKVTEHIRTQFNTHCWECNMHLKSAYFWICQWCFSVQFSSITQSCPTLCDPMNCSTQASLSITNSQSSPKLMSIESVMPFYHLLFCHPLLLLPSIFPSIRVFSSESALPIRWPEYWSFSFNISPSNEHSRLISFRMNWLDLLAVQGTLKSSPTPQLKSINPSALSFLYSLTLHPYMTTG